jgi:hypothetical protein
LSDRLLALLIWILAFLGFSGGGVVAAFYPGVVQRALLSQPKPRFAPKAEDGMVGRWMGGRKYLESESYIVTLRVVGFASLAVAVLMLVHLVEAFLRFA